MNFRDSEESDRRVIEVLSRHSSEGTEERLEKLVSVQLADFSMVNDISKNSLELTSRRVCYFI